MNLRDLKEKRAQLVQEMRSIADNPKGQNGDLDENQAKKFDELKAENESLEKQIERQAAVDEAERRMSGEPVSGGDTYESELQNFSFRKALAGAAGLDVDWGREKEVGQEYAKRAGITPQGVVIPVRAGETRATLLSNVSELKPTEHMSQSFIDKLRSNVVVRKLGATMLSDLTGDVAIPGLGSSHSASWFDENGTIPLSSMGTKQVTLSPKHVGARTELSRNTLLQTSPDIEQLIQNDLSKVLARAVDQAALMGTGSSEPIGILERSISQVSPFDANWASIQDLIGALEDANATGNGFCTTPAVVRTFRSTNKVSSEPEHGFIMQDRQTLDGYPVAKTTHMQDGVLLFGDFEDVLIGQWGGIELLANPYAQGSYEAGNVQYRIIQTLDTQVRRSESFAYGDLNASG